MSTSPTDPDPHTSTQWLGRRVSLRWQTSSGRLQPVIPLCCRQLCPTPLPEECHCTNSQSSHMGTLHSVRNTTARLLPYVTPTQSQSSSFRLLPHQHYHCPDLALCWDPAEPVISGQIMEIHHSKHHATYVTNLNKALEQYAEAEAKHDLQKMISLQSAINFNGGGALPVTHSTW